MVKSNFAFIDNVILRNNLDEVFDHILVLLPFTESKTYNKVAKSAFRKTIIIHTASIIEALLFYLLDKRFNNSQISELHSSWSLKNKKDIYKVNENYIIVSGDYKKQNGKIKKETMNLGQIAKLLKDQQIIKDNLFSKIDKVRKLRNDQHLGTHKKVKTYSKKDLENAFAVASEVKSFVISEMKK